MARSFKNALLRLASSWRGLTFQLFITTILPLTALLLVIAFSSIQLHQRAMRTMVGERDERAIQTAASALSAQIDHRIAAIQSLALNTDLEDPDALDDVLSTFSHLTSVFDLGLAFFSQDGELLGATGDRALWESIASRELIELAVPFKESKEEAIISPAFLHPTNGENVVLILSLSQRSDIIAAGAFLPQKMIARTLSGAFDNRAQSRVMVIDKDGELLYLDSPRNFSDSPTEHPGIAEALAGESGATYIQAGDSEHVVAFSPIPPAGWALLAEESWAMVSSPILRTTQIAPLLLVPVLLIAILALGFGARQVIQPLQALESKAAKLAWGDYRAIAEPVGGITEIRHLQTELVHLAQKVQAAQQSLRGYIGAITAGQEEERRRLARELHDDTIQALIALKQRVQLAQLNSQNDLAIQSLQEIETLTEETIENLRRLTRALRPIYLEDLGLVAALGMLARETEQATEMKVDFQVMGHEQRLHPNVELALYRIAQEALSNVSRHAEATRAMLLIAFEGNTVTLEVIDNGKGFTVPKSPAEFAPGGHYGLLGLYERAELIGATLEIQSSPDQGTRVSVRLATPGGKSESRETIQAV